MGRSVEASREPLAASSGLMRLAARLAGASDAEDLVQATYVKALENDGTIRSRPAWLRQVLVNERRMEIRGRTRRDAREQASASPDETMDVDEVVHCLEVARIVQELLEELDDDVRTVVRQRYFDGESAAEIARKHALPAGTVRWRLKAGLDRLRGELDARYGGRRQLWAGGFAPATMVPTLPEGAASQPGTVGGTATATAKGTKVMSVKLLIGLGLATAAAGGAIVINGGNEDEAYTDAAEVSAGVSSASAPARDGIPPAKASPAAAQHKAVWAARRAKIQNAHAALKRPEAGAAVGASADEPACSDGECLTMCTEKECYVSLAEQVHGMYKGCDGFLSDTGGNVSLTASIIGAPDIGTIVESVDVDAAAPHQAELVECLTEAMYTLELGEMEGYFEQSITVMLSGKKVSPETEDESDHAVYKFHHDAGADLDDLGPETRKRIEAVLAAKGEAGEVRVIHLDQEPAAADE